MDNEDGLTRRQILAAGGAGIGTASATAVGAEVLTDGCLRCTPEAIIQGILDPCRKRDNIGILDEFQTVPHRKHPENPVVSGSSIYSTQSYPPSVIRVNGTYFAIVKSYPALVLFSSDDGISWKEERVIVQNDKSWRNKKVSSPLVRFDPNSDHYHLFFSARSSNSWSIGHLSTDELTDKEVNVDSILYTSEEFRQEMGDETVEKVVLSDVICDDNRFVYYGTTKHSNGSWKVWIGFGEEWDDINPNKYIFDSSHNAVFGDIIQTPNVVKIAGKFFMSYTAGISSDVIGERQVYLAVGDSYDSFEPTKQILVPYGTCGSWDERRTYGSQWLKTQDGSYTNPEIVEGMIRLYYSGHDLGTNGIIGNMGKTGLVEYDIEYFEKY
ncbi:hypothetical protein [Halobellus inordinatus]|uniref:hypothetical protein n=1 Tax=Halobellus inordinatus TaxID=1126236 RepID=UPI002109338A|nr:hypothetical protein [Halobellus inordinatus]